jgi:hypothetical protein
MADENIEKLEYPKQTEGSVMADAVRARTNHLSDEEHERNVEIGLSIIYGGQPVGQAAGARH